MSDNTKDKPKPAEIARGCFGLIVLILGLVFMFRWCAGCGSERPNPIPPAAPMIPNADFFPAPPPGMFKKEQVPRSTQEPQSLDFTGLRGVLPGKWQKIQERTSYSEPAILDFTEKSVEETRFGFTHVGKYVVKDGLITFTDRDRDVNIYGLEFLSDSEIGLRPERVQNGTDFNDLSGRWRRISLPPGQQLALGSGPIADAKRQVQRIEQKLAKVEAILKSALSDRDEYAAKLRSLGVNSSADLKGNIRGQRVAENLVKLATEIEGLERQLAVIDTELLKAKTIVRRLEQESAGLTEEERQQLAFQLKETEDRMNATPTITTPINVDAAVEKALKESAKSKNNK